MRSIAIRSVIRGGLGVILLVCAPALAHAQIFGWCEEICRVGFTDCNASCTRARPLLPNGEAPLPAWEYTNCGAFGQCANAYCNDICSPSSSCSTQCTLNSNGAPSSCGNYGVCGGYPPGGGGPTCSSCNIYSRCDQQCVGGPPNPYNHTCSEYTPCGQCAPPVTYTQRFWNDGSGNCYNPGVPFEGQSGGTCVFDQFVPYDNPPYCSYNCTVECPNLQ